MKKFWTSKRFWFLILALIVIGLFIYLIYFSQEENPLEELLAGGVSPEEVKSDKSEPASQIQSPDSGIWQNEDFLIDVLDEDLETGLDSDSCQYKILSYETNGQEHSTGWMDRKCNSFNSVGVGEGKACRFQGEKACWVFVRSQDKAANWHLPGEEKGSVKYYHVDWSGPEVEQISIEGKEIQIEVKDNFKVTACNLYLEDENLGPMSFLVPGCQRECQASKTLDFEFKPGTHKILAVCQDAAGNYGWSEELTIKENLPPEISSCRVNPTQGNLESNFQFEIEVTDPDGDDLTYLWNFGDGQSSSEKSPTHRYSKTGTFEPEVEVIDSQGAKDNCSTAWVVVTE